MLAAPVLPKVEIDVNAQQYAAMSLARWRADTVWLGNSLRRVLLSSLEGSAITPSGSQTSRMSLRQSLGSGKMSSR